MDFMDSNIFLLVDPWFGQLLIHLYFAIHFSLVGNIYLSIHLAIYPYIYILCMYLYVWYPDYIRSALFSPVQVCTLSSHYSDKTSIDCYETLPQVGRP